MFVIPLAQRAVFPPVLARRLPRTDTIRRPAMDVAETDTAYTLTFDLPGLRRDQVEIDVEGDRLDVRSKADEATSGDDPRVVWRERAQPRFARSLTLPEGIDRGAIAAKFADGVLTVTLPKVAKPAPVRVTIN